MSPLEIMIGAAFVFAIRRVTRRAHRQRRTAPDKSAPPAAPLLGVVYPDQRDGTDLDAKIGSL